MYDNVFNAYPIYDWLTEDIWVANGKYEWSYNKLYDIYYQAHITYHCEKAKQEDIERVCAEMLDLEFKV